MGIDGRLKHTNRKISAGDTRISVSAGWIAVVPDAISTTGSFVAAESSNVSVNFCRQMGKERGTKEVKGEMTALERNPPA